MEESGSENIGFLFRKHEWDIFLIAFLRVFSFQNIPFSCFGSHIFKIYSFSDSNADKNVLQRGILKRWNSIPFRSRNSTLKLMRKYS